MTSSTTRPQVRRRTVLAGGAAGLGLASLATVAPDAEAAKAAGSRFFRHGVASGDPLPHRVVIWTRVTPTEQSSPGSGHGPRVSVQWEVARDAHFKRVVRQGEFSTGPQRDHTVKLDVTGLKPGTWYHYRFRYHGTTSRVGRLRTAPARRSSPKNLRLGVVSCANWQAGFFAAYRGIAARDDLHAVVHLGDYIYEYGKGQYGYGMGDTDIRVHDPAHEIVTLEDYRRRHAQYKTDHDLQDAHAKYTWIVTWDDHEIADNGWREGAANHQPATEGGYDLRRTRSHRAYDEWMPARLSGSVALGDGDRLYRRFQFGRLLELSMLDLRNYRSEQLGAQQSTHVGDPGRTITGAKQLRWLKNSLRRNRSLWTVIGNPVMITPVDFGAVPHDVLGPVNDVTGLLPPDGVPYNTDQWDGYTHDRTEVLNFIRDHDVPNAVFITGDIHSAWAADVPFDAATYPISGSAGVELVATSVTSNNLKDILGVPAHTGSRAVEAAILANNRHIKYLDFDDHGFSVLDVTTTRTQMDWFTIGDRAVRDTPITHSVSYATKVGTNTVVAVDRPVS